MSLFSTLKFITTHPLNRDRKISAVARFMTWQIKSRLARGAMIHAWVNGSRFLVQRGETGLTGNIYTGLHEFPDMGFLLHVLRPEDLFVDVGANVGSYTVLACAAIGAKGVAFEPVPATYARLVENVSLNHLDDTVVAKNCGVGAAQATLRFTRDEGCMNHALAAGEQHADTVEVPVTTLDAALNGRAPFLMKIDVEGYETCVLEGAVATLSNPSLHAVIMELNGSGARYGYDEAQILAQMAGHGFQTFSYDPLTRTLLSLGGKNLESGNTLFIRDVAWVEARLASAPKVRVNGRDF
jgi:FkbM family methyltransferase